MREATDLRDSITTWRELERRTNDLAELFDLAVAEDDEATLADVERELSEIGTELDRHEIELMFGGEYDRKPAYLSIHAGAGGTESQDWADMLLRMYLRWADEHRFKTEIVDLSHGEEAGIKSATVEVQGPNAYGFLRSERGVHRLVRLSPYDAAHRRHTSFALVEVMPETDDDVSVEINPDDVRVDVFRSAGAGGQNVQKNSTAIRLTHLPTGIVVTCQNERSQLQNKETAMRVLKSRLLELELEKREAEQARIKGEHLSAGWGNQIRSYVLHPYNMVKDHRTGFETSNTNAVLEGEIDEFLDAYLRQTLGQEN